jgi:hypothetical protein
LLYIGYMCKAFLYRRKMMFAIKRGKLLVAL